MGVNHYNRVDLLIDCQACEAVMTCYYYDPSRLQNDTETISELEELCETPCITCNADNEFVTGRHKFSVCVAPRQWSTVEFSDAAFVLEYIIGQTC